MTWDVRGQKHPLGLSQLGGCFFPRRNDQMCSIWKHHNSPHNFRDLPKKNNPQKCIYIQKPPPPPPPPTPPAPPTPPIFQEPGELTPSQTSLKSLHPRPSPHGANPAIEGSVRKAKAVLFQRVTFLQGVFSGWFKIQKNKDVHVVYYV